MAAMLSRIRRFLTPDDEVSSRALMILLIPLTVYRKSHRIFYRGPAAFNYPGLKIAGYRSPNVLLSLWLHAGIRIWLTTYGRYLLLAWVLFIMIGILSILMPAYILAFGLTALFVVDFLTGWLFRPHLQIQRNLPLLAVAKTPIAIDYKILNNGSRPCWGLFVDVLASGEATWPNGLPWIRDMAPGTNVELRNHLVIANRGRVELPVCLVGSAFPFGLWRWSSRAQPNAAIHVYPNYNALAAIELPADGHSRNGSATAVSGAASDSAEFMGIREFRYGDNPRMIHAASWARLQQPVVKEFRDRSMTRIALVVDTCCTPLGYWQQLRKLQNEKLEAILYLTAACADTLSRQNYVVDYFAIGQGSIHSPAMIDGTHGAGQLEEILKAVAAVSANDDQNFPGLPTEQLRAMEEVSSALVIMQELDEPRRRLLRTLENRGVALKPILVMSRLQAPPHNADLPPYLTLLKAQDILAGEIRNI